MLPVIIPARVSVNYQSGAREVLRKLFARDLGDVELARAVGALDDSLLIARASGENAVLIKVLHPHITRQERTIQSDSQGALTIRNEYFIAASQAPPGTGLRSFLTQVTGAQALGIARLETFAAGHYAIRETWNGYYTWARFG